MEPYESSLDRIATAVLVVRVLDDIDASSEEDRDMLLCDLLQSTWGSIQAQNQ